MQNLFDAELRQNIAKTIKRHRKDGVVKMSLENLRAVTPTPRTTNGAPQGGNLQWQYAQRFQAIVQADPAFTRFTSI